MDWLCASWRRNQSRINCAMHKSACWMSRHLWMHGIFFVLALASFYTGSFSVPMGSSNGSLVVMSHALIVYLWFLLGDLRCSVTRLAFGSAGKQKASSWCSHFWATSHGSNRSVELFFCSDMPKLQQWDTQVTETLNPEPDMATIDTPLFTWFLYPGFLGHTVHV